MKRFIAIGLIAAILLSSTEAYQLLKVPFLFKHFVTHHQENPRLSFLGFLSMHYLHGSPKDKDYSDDMKLPFKTTNSNTVSFSVPVIIPAPIALENTQCQEQPTKSIIVHRDLYLPSPHLSAIWQPPKCS